jgi:hypothetical protein
MKHIMNMHGVEVHLYAALTSASCSSCFIPVEGALVFVGLDIGWVQKQVYSLWRREKLNADYFSYLAQSWALIYHYL